MTTIKTQTRARMSNKVMVTLHPEERIWLKEYRKALLEQQPDVVKRMLLYGSKARGDAREDSDIDILLIVKNEAASRKRALRRIGYSLSATSYAVPSIRAYTEEEWAQRKSIGATFPETVEQEAVDLL